MTYDYVYIFKTNSEVLNNKTLIPFSTHEGSGLSGFDRKLSNVLPNATVLEGLAIRGNECQNKKDDVNKKINECTSKLKY